jgi:hypothetical protein
MKLTNLFESDFDDKKHLNEVDPRNFDSDEDYYAALKAPAKRRSAPSDYPYSPEEDEAYFREIWRKKREAAKKAEQDGEQGIAEGSEGNWYVRVKGKVLKDKKFNAIPFTSQEEAHSKAMEIHSKKRIPLSQLKLTRSWMDAPEQGVAESTKDSAPKMGSQERKMAQGAVKGAKDMTAALGLVRGKDGVARLPNTKKKQGVAEGSDSYTVANDPEKPGMYHYSDIEHALQNGHSDQAKIYKHNKFLSTVGDARKELEEGVWGDTAKLIGIPAVAGALAVGAQHYDDQKPHVEVGGQNAMIVQYGSSRIPDNAMLLKGADGKMYRVWQQSGKGMNKMTLASPAEVKEGVAEGHADQQRKIFKKNGQPVGEVGIDRESSPGGGQWYMKCYAHNIDNAGYDSYEEAVEELKHCLKQGVAEAKKKDDEDLGPQVKDVALQRAITRAKSDFPTAGSGLEALAKDFMRGQDQDQKTFDQIRQAERRQDQMLSQISKIDQQQEKEIDDLENQNSGLAQRLQQLQSVNSELEKKLAAMTGRRAEKKSSAAAPVVTATPAAPMAKDAAPVAKSKAKAKTTQRQPKSSATKSMASQLAGTPISDLTTRLTKGDDAILDKVTGQQALPFEPSDNVLEPSIARAQQNPRFAAARANASDADPRYYQDLTSKIARDAVTDPEKAIQTYRVHEGNNEEQEADYSDKYQDMVARVGQKAREQEKKNPVDIADLARRLAAIEASRKDK